MLYFSFFNGTYYCVFCTSMINLYTSKSGNLCLFRRNKDRGIILDKHEYQIRNDEIKALIKKREFQKAVEIADTIDWTKVRSVTTLCTISDLYKVNRRYSEAKILLEQAYDKYPNGRMIVYSLCELSIRMGEIVQAIEYYKQYVSQWPTDKGKFILQYKIYETQDVSIEERIAVLEELKKRDYEEKWGYELANLYHRMGLATKCVEECDELIVWFREGPYVKKAMELKMLHQQLTDSQMDLYESMMPPKPQQPVEVQPPVAGDAQKKNEEDDIMVKTMDMGQYNTINLQRALAESMKDVLVADNGFAPLVEMPAEPTAVESLTQEIEIQDIEEQLEKPFDVEQQKPFTNTGITKAIIAPMMEGEDEEETETEEVNEADVVNEVKEVENVEPAADTVEIKQEIPQAPAEVAPKRNSMQDTGEMEELFFDDECRDTEELRIEARAIRMATNEEIPRSIYNDEKFEQKDDTEKYDPVRDLELTMMYDPSMLPEELKKEGLEIPEQKQEVVIETAPAVDPGATRIFTKEDLNIIETAKNAVIEEFPREDIGDRGKEELLRLIDEKVQEALANALNSDRIFARTQAQMAARYAEAPSAMDNMLSQEYDGQISMVLPDKEPVEKQITGQLNIEDLLGEWENTKKHSQEKQEAQTARLVEEHTGRLFTEFEEKARDGILEKLERENLEDSEQVDIDAEYQKYVDSVMAEEKPASEESAAEEFAVEELEEITDENVDIPEEASSEEVPVETVELPLDELAEELNKSEEAVDTADEEESVEELEEEPKEVLEEEEELITETTKEDEATEDLTEDEAESEPQKDEDIMDETDGDTEAEEDFGEDDEEDDESYEEEEEEEPAPDVDRSMTEDEISLFGQFAQTKRARQKLLRALDKVSLAAYTGNIYVTGDTAEESLELAKNVVRYVQSTDHNFSGKIAKVTGQSLNNKSVEIMIEKLANGGLIIEKASGMSAETTKDLLKALNQEKTGIVVVLQDSKKRMHKMMEFFDGMKQIFNVHVEVEELSDDALVAYGKKYAEHLEYAIDDMGVLALHTRIDELQTSDHVVTVSDVRDIVDEAIDNANRKSFKHFTDVLFAKRYDDEDMIILREKDFIEY